MMNRTNGTSRRSVVAGALVMPVVAALPLSAAGQPAPQHGVYWRLDSRASVHASLAQEAIDYMLREGHAFARAEISLDYAFPLTRPSFVVKPTDIVFCPTRGFRYEPTLTIDIYERGTFLGQAYMCSNMDYEAYWGRPKPVDRPDFWFVSFHVPYENNELRASRGIEVRNADWQVVERRPPRRRSTIQQIEAALGKDAVQYDMRWFKN